MNERVQIEIGHRLIESGPLRIHCAVAGASDAPLIVLLHGFPARWSTWRGVMPLLASAGYLVVAPDLRGSGESDKPTELAAYSMQRFVDDVAAVIHSFGRDRTHLVGHDVGGGVAWATAMKRPDLVDRLAILNSVHPVGFKRRMAHPSQLIKSWYIFAFQVPRLPEWLIVRNDYGLMKREMAIDGLDEATVDDLLEGITPSGALHGMLGWYRALFREALRQRFVPQKVDVPTLVVWGDQERHLDGALADPPPGWVKQCEVKHIEHAGHWVQHDAPEQVSRWLVAHFHG